MGTAIKHPVLVWVKSSFVILTSGHSDAQGSAPECLDVKNYKWRLNPAWHRMLYSCTHMTTVGVKGLTGVGVTQIHGIHHVRNKHQSQQMPNGCKAERQCFNRRRLQRWPDLSPRWSTDQHAASHHSASTRADGRTRPESSWTASRTLPATSDATADQQIHRLLTGNDQLES